VKRMVQSAFLAAVIGIATLGLGTDAQAALSYGDPLLRVGSKGEQVTVLQEDLRLLGYFHYPTNTGYYGTITEAAVKSFQRENGLTADGIVGPKTGQLLQQEAAKERAYPARGIIATALQYVGVPYKWGGTSPSGFDCSGFVQYVLAKHNLSVPRTATQMYAIGKAVSAPQPGDLVFFSTYAPGASHVGIYMGNNQFISATSSKGVKVDLMNNSYWGPRYIGARTLR
jgi:cell wall-associated NlpC family hydrolase